MRKKIGSDIDKPLVCFYPEMCALIVTESESLYCGSITAWRHGECCEIPAHKFCTNPRIFHQGPDAKGRISTTLKKVVRELLT
jgi:hypothetical protein